MVSRSRPRAVGGAVLYGGTLRLPPRVMSLATVAPAASLHEHAERVPLPDAHRLAADFVAQRVVDMAVLIDSPAAPDILDAAYVQTLLTEPYGNFAPCINSLCIGLDMPGRFPLRQYVSPAHAAHYHATGRLPPELAGGVCYLCHLSIAIVVAELGGAALLPFFHAVNVPGGYVPAALQPAAIGDGMLHPIRRLLLTDYVLGSTTVHEVAAYDAGGVVSEWTQVDVRGYRELATLLFGTNNLLVPRTNASPHPLVAAPELPSCEAVICRKLCAPGEAVSFDYLDTTSRTVFCLPVRLATTLGGITAPPSIEVPAAGASGEQMRYALMLRPLPEARAILMNLVARAANNWMAVARQHGLMPPRTLAQAGRIELELPLRTHMLLYLVLARYDDIGRMLIEEGLALVQTLGALEQLGVYREALQPLRDEMLRRVDAGEPVDDAYWWSPDGTDLLPWLRWMPRPPPAFYVLSDLVAHTPTVSVCPPPAQAVNRLPGDGMALSYPTFDAARAAVPAAPSAPYWPCPPGCVGSAWNTIVWRVNAAYDALLRTTSRLATLADGAVIDAETAMAAACARAVAAGGRPTTAELAAAVCATDVAPSERGALMTAAQQYKRVIAAHVPLVQQLRLAGATSDETALSIAHSWAPRHAWAPSMLCAETMFAAPFHAPDFAAASDTPQTLYAWVLAGAAPTTGIDVVARWRHAAAESAEWREWSRQALYASLVGLYGHACNVVPFDAWITLREAVWSDAIAALETERVLLLVLREHMIDACTRAPAARIGIRAVYPAWTQFVANTLEHADHMRAVAAAGDLAAVAAYVERSYVKAAQTWPPFHRPAPPFPTMFADVLRSIDAERGIAACMAARCVLAAADLAPPQELIRAIGAYVEREPRPRGVLSLAWLRDIGVSTAGLATVAALQHEHASGALNVTVAQVRARQLADQHPDDYARVSVFFAVLVQHTRRQAVLLDADTAARQRKAARPGATTCSVSSVQCCNTLKTFVVQDGDNLTGTQPARLNLDTGRTTCVPKRGRQYAMTRSAERNCSTAAVALAMRAWVEGTGSADAVLERLGPYMNSLMRDRYRLPCASMDIVTWPTVGAVFEQHNADNSVLSCTVCPRCGGATMYSAGMFSSNMFSCGACERVMRAQMTEAGTDRCMFCNMQPEHVRRMTHAGCMTRMLGAAHDAHYIVLDDSVDGIAVARKMWVCGVCNEPWLEVAARHFGMRELRWLRDNPDSHGGDMMAIIDSDQQTALLRDIRRSRADPRVPVPMPTTVPLLARPAQARKRKIGSVKL